MKSRLLMLLAAAALWLIGASTAAAALDDPSLRAALDAYVDAWYAGDAAKLEAVTHSDLVRRKAALADTDGRIRLEEIDQLGLLAAARNGLGQRAPAEDRRRITTEVLDQRGISALAVVETGGSFSYLQLVRNAGRWQVLTVLWEPKASPEEGREMGDAQSVAATVEDYLQGWYSGDPERMQRALHPGLLKRKPALLDRQGNIRIDALNAVEMIDATRSGGGSQRKPGERQTSMKVLDIRGRSAVAVLETGDFFDYLALVRDRGRWQIVNALWEPRID